MDRRDLEHIVTELLQAYQIHNAPIPIEMMLQVPLPDMWTKVDFKIMSIGFRAASLPYGPRMSLARLLARHIVFSTWGEKHGLRAAIMQEADPEAFIHAFARKIVMPKFMIDEINPAAHDVATLTAHFHVPEEDALLRLEDLNALY